MPQPDVPSTPARNPWAWVPTLYLAEGLPYVVVMAVSVIVYKGLGISNTDIALYTSWLYLPWVIKPLWSPIVDLLKTRRLWIWAMQLVIGAGFAGVALSLQAPKFFQYSLAFLWLLAFSSATHDIAADGFYMLATTEKQQAFFVGIRSTFYRIATITGQGLLVMLAGFVQSYTGLPAETVKVIAKPTASVHEIKAEWPARSSADQRELFVVTESRAVEISAVTRSQRETSQLIFAARKHNEENGFCPPEPTRLEDSNWWSRAIAEPLQIWLGRHFGIAQTQSDAAGNVESIRLQLSKAPGKQVVVTLALKSGDKSIHVVEGARLSFDDSNWNKSAVVMFQLDSKLRAESSAVYEIRSGDIPLSWLITFFLLAAMFLFFAVYHRFILPRPDRDKPGEAQTALRFLKEFLQTFGSFFTKRKIWALLLFLLFYRFAEAQLVKMAVPFLVDGREIGGLGLTTGQVGFVYGTVGIIALMCGGLLGGVVVSRQGLKFWLWPMVFAIHLPDAVFIYLAYAQPESLFAISFCVAIEQLGYGFGFTAYMLYMIHIARGEHSTAHYAICTGFMALGMMLPGMWSGWLQESIGYQHFFVWVMLATIPGFIVAMLIPLDAEFGKKR